MKPGIVRISLDFECGWGYISDGTWQNRESSGVYRDLRQALKRFTDRADELELSLCWAVVGAMIESPTQRDFSHLRGQYAKDIGKFLSNADSLTHDGRDLLDLVTSMRTRQIFGTHTYSHMIVSDDDQDEQVFKQDLEKAINVNKNLGLSATRLVFPRNHFGEFETVRSTGITHVRMPPFNMAHPTNRPNRLARAVSITTRPVSAVTEQQHSSGLMLHYASEFLNWGKRSNTTKRWLQRRRIEKTLEQAAEGSDVHFWLHPFNLTETPGLSDYIDTFLIRIATLRDQNRLQVKGF